MGRPARVGSGGPATGAAEGPGATGGPGRAAGPGGAGTGTAGVPGLASTGGEAAPGEGFAAEGRRNSRVAPSSPVAAATNGRARSAGEAMGKRRVRSRYRLPPLLQKHPRGVKARAARWWPGPQGRPGGQNRLRVGAAFIRAGAAPIRHGCGAPRSRRARSRPRRWPPGPHG